MHLLTPTPDHWNTKTHYFASCFSAQLEMDAISRVITIPIALVKELDSSGKILSAYAPPGSQPGSQGGYNASQPGSYNPSQQNGSGNGSYRPPSAPMGSATPMHPSMMTPSHNLGNQTPMHAPYTPAHAPYTPAHPSQDDYGRERDRDARDSRDRRDDHGRDYRDEGREDRDRDHFGSAPTPGNFVAYTPALTPSGYTPSDAPYPSAPTPRDYGKCRRLCCPCDGWYPRRLVQGKFGLALRV